ncbi:tRNA pseudouridine synthase A, partial [Yersinia pestis PY-11]
MKIALGIEYNGSR